MAATLTFDTFKFIEKLENAGISRAHAKAEAEALTEVFATNASELAIKGNLQNLEEKMNGKLTLLQWMIGFSLAFNVAIFLKLMGRY